MAVGTLHAGQKLTVAEKKATVLAWFAEHPNGTTRQAAAALDIPRSSVDRLLKSAIADFMKKPAEDYLAAMVNRNQQIIEAFLPLAIIRGSVPHAQAILAADQRTAKLLGLDAPIKVDYRKIAEETAERYGLTDDERHEFFEKVETFMAATA